MRWKVFLSSLFIVIFVITYLGLCYMIPGWRIKLEAEPVVYLIESIKSMVLVKTGISILVGTIVTAVVARLGKKRKG